MGAYCGAKARIYDANEAIRLNNTSPNSQELLASINVTSKGTDGRVPFLQACKYGRQRMVEFMLKHDKKQRISAEYVDSGLINVCGGDTSRNMVFILHEVAGANVNSQDSFGNTPLMMLSKKSQMTSRYTLAQRLDAAVYILDKGARIDHRNREGMSAITIACRDGNERFALLLAEKGADIMHVYDWMNNTKNQSRNWTGGSILTKYAFEYPKFVDSIQEWYWDSVGDAPRGDGSLNNYQLKVFIGRLLKEAYQAGLMPKAAFFDSGGMNEHEIQGMLERRARDMLHGYFGASRAKMAKYWWKDLVVIVKNFFVALWNQDRPADADAELEWDLGAAKALGPDGKEPEPDSEEEEVKEEEDDGIVRTELAADWSAVVDPSSGNVYYVNVITSETRWEPPGGMGAYET